MFVALRPTGRVSVTVTIPLVGAKPEFVAVIVYVAPTCPWVKLPLCDLAMVMSGSWLIVVGLVAESLAVLVWPPPETFAVLVTLAAALLATFTVRVMAGELAAAASALLRGQ